MVGRCTATFIDASLFWLVFYLSAIKLELPQNWNLLAHYTDIEHCDIYPLSQCWDMLLNWCYWYCPLSGQVGYCRWTERPLTASCSEGERKAFWIFLGQFWVFSVTACLYIFFSVRMFTPVFRVNQISSRFGWLIHLLLLRPVSRPY